MIIIADSGGTKVEWCLVNDAQVVERFNTPGMNALMLSPVQMRDRIAAEVAAPLAKYLPEITAVYFYGAGCVPGPVSDQVAEALRHSFATAQIEVSSDLLGTARALCGDAPGIACILGTGANSCYYDGHAIADNVSALGYILGDEGSGAYLGKMLVSDVFKRQLPEHVREKFLAETGLTVMDVIQHVYREPGGQRYLASYSPFLKANIDEPSVHKLVFDAFCAFFRRNIVPYGKQLKVNFTGSVAYHYSDVLAEAAQSCGFEVGTIYKAPMDGLILYHQK